MPPRLQPRDEDTDDEMLREDTTRKSTLVLIFMLKFFLDLSINCAHALALTHYTPFSTHVGRGSGGEDRRDQLH